MALTAFDASRMAVVGFLALGYQPTAPAGAEDPGAAVDWGAAEAGSLELAPPRLAWISSVFYGPGRADVTKALLSRAFALDPDLEALAALTQPATEARARAGLFVPPGMEGLAHTVSKSAILGAGLVVSRRDDCLPRLSVRQAQERDYDDIRPLLDETAAWCPALAQLATGDGGDEEDGEFALARAIKSQDDTRKVVVVEAAGEGVVGVLAASADVDLGVLYDHFDLDAFDWFMEPEDYDSLAAQTRAECEEAAREARTPARRPPSDGGEEGKGEGAAAGEGSAGSGMGAEASDGLLLKNELSIITEGSQDGLGGATPGSKADLASDEAGGSEAGAAKGETGAGDGAGDGDGDGAGAGDGAGDESGDEAGPTPEQVDAMVRQVMADKCAAGEGRPSAFAVTMLCIRPGWDHVGLELVRGAFAAFRCLYAVVTLPHGSPQPPVLHGFSRVQPLAGVAFPETLHCFHSHGLSKGFRVRAATADDEAGAAELTAGLATQGDILASIQEAVQDKRGASGVFVAECQGEVVGVATLIGEVDLAALSALYHLPPLVSSRHHPANGHAEADMFVLSPVFAWRTRFFLRECMRLMGKTCLYYALPLGEPPQEVVGEFLQAPTVHAPAPGAALPPFGLYLHPCRLSHHVPSAVTARVVVVGSSDTGMAAVEALLTSRHLRFDDVTLVSPGGAEALGKAGTTPWLDRIGLEGSVAVVEGTVVGLDRNERAVGLEDGRALPYDVLVLAPGLQDPALEGLLGGGERPPVISYEELCMSMSPEVGEELAQTASAALPVAVVGNTPRALAAVGLLQRCGVPAEAIVHVTEDAGLSAVLRLAGAEAGKQLTGRLQVRAPPAGYAYAVKEVGDFSDSSLSVDLVATAVDEAASGQPLGSAVGTEVLDARLLVLCGAGAVDAAVAELAQGASLVFDGRLVVDGAFRTNDPDVYAAGPAARFSARYGAGGAMDHCDPVEVGGLLGEAVAARFSAAAARMPGAGGGGAGGPGHAPGDEAPRGAPPMLRARQVEVAGPDGATFVLAGDAAAWRAAGSHDPDGAGLWVPAEGSGETVLRTSRAALDGGAPLVRMVLNRARQVQSLVYVGPDGEFARRARSLVGLPVSYLGSLFEDHAAGKVPDLHRYLTQDWCQALYHEAFAEMRAGILSLVAARIDLDGPEAAEGMGGTTQAQVQEALLATLEAHSSVLGQYDIPA